MEFIKSLIDHFLHLDAQLGEVIQNYGVWTYTILFLIVFCETGLVVTPFLPGDSLLFAAGAFAARGDLNVLLLFATLCVAAIVGDTVNYWIGHYIGPKIFHKENVRFLNKKHLERTHGFYERYGGKTIIIARFIPIIRTFAPFVAGIGSMSYWRFIAYNIIGGLLWVSVCVFGGYFFGNLEIVKRNFSLVMLAIVLISLLPIIIEFARQRFGPRKGPDTDGASKNIKSDEARASRVID
jgi:membrane-associated protein